MYTFFKLVPILWAKTTTFQNWYSLFNSASNPLQFRFKTVSKSFQFRFKIVSFPFQNRFKNGIKVDVVRNLCPCGHYPDRNKCNCSETAIERYQKSISKPILERIDICVESSPIKFSELSSGEGGGEKSEVIRKRVEECREIQKERFKNYKNIHYNSQMTTKEIKKFCEVGTEEKEYLRKIFNVKKLSARTYHKVLKVVRTIVDMAKSDEIKVEHLVEALYLNLI